MNTNSEGVPSQVWWTLGIIVIGLLALGVWVAFFSGKAGDKAATQTAVPPSCEEWEAQYGVVSWDKFPEDTLHVGLGEEWVIRLHPTEASGWIILDPRARDNWTRPTGVTHMIFSDGLEITDAPGKTVERGRRNTFRTWGEGCLLVQVSGF
ncbi:hypothetical protein A2127_00915 [Candidatus Jorgensenbacteria bacterium GWC1_48_12]|uniref:Uncharacterized protein n=1 Tax=Candidatus Jorgensenbacteria bacterium GWC1_48_12 TaxID=1798469 RepID=A0A1F6BM50_9BACT|nr:MAG: hypothetical protein A2127_00915 [Candidatus Jorgensenbacteria bacterium GWC1_48_12]